MVSITILIVNYNSSDFVNLSLYALEKLTKNYYKVFIIDNGSKISDYKKLMNFVKNYKNVKVERKLWKFNSASMHHATALNYLIKYVKTDYFAVLDADATFLIKNWDEILINKMNKNTPVGGTQAPPFKPQDFPLMFAILFRTKEFMNLNIDFRPRNIGKHEDTGIEIREKYLSKNYDCILLKSKITRNYKKGPFKTVICVEYYLDNQAHIFASHFARGSTLGKNKYKKNNIFNKVPFFFNLYLELKGKSEKFKWIKIAKNVVDFQK